MRLRKQWTLFNRLNENWHWHITVRHANKLIGATTFSLHKINFPSSIFESLEEQWVVWHPRYNIHSMGGGEGSFKTISNIHNQFTDLLDASGKQLVVFEFLFPVKTSERKILAICFSSRPEQTKHMFSW